jgi:cytochrome c
MILKLAMATAVLALSMPSAFADGDATAGAVVFKKCQVCHTNEAGKNKIGPSLFGVVGRPSASIAGFNYSDAMKAANKIWDPATLNIWLTEPKALVPGTKMIFPGLKDEKDRQDVIAYLETLK